jgi:hypothetical protein
MHPQGRLLDHRVGRHATYQLVFENCLAGVLD